ncbi:MAG: glucose 1-dehydrogenase [Clostridiales Family XIII bacterium]|jgi:NAD(P)-dependent dehydrogenase (short-subunit alcohol dehydrogenase family)|nr:glucose 1-dehydrogenase [Clostridiales Family XIII bacterium]
MAITVSGKWAVVTGGTKGIGKGIAEALAANGASTVIVSRSQADCDAVSSAIREQYGTASVGIAADLTKAGDIAGLVEKAVAAAGRIDVLVNNAGAAITKRAEDLTEEDWDRVISLDLKAVFFTAQAFGRHMIENKGGSIVNIASMLGLVADKQVLPYCVAKGGVIQMTRALALEWVRHGIRVNAVCPGYVMTDMNRADLENEKIAAHLLGKIPMRRYAQVGEITDAIVFLASDSSSYMTGQHIVMDGGWTAE